MDFVETLKNQAPKDFFDAASMASQPVQSLGSDTLVLLQQAYDDHVITKT